VDRLEPPSCRSFVKEVVDSPRRFGADSIHLHQVGDGGALDRLKGPEVMQQSPFPGWADASDLLQAGLTQVTLAAGPVGREPPPTRLVAPPPHRKQKRIPRPALLRSAARGQEN